MFSFFRKAPKVVAKPEPEVKVVSPTAERLKDRDPMLLSIAEILKIMNEVEASNARS